MSRAPHCIVDGSTGPLVRRKVVVFRRLEPGDVRTPGTHALPHSPYLEAKIEEVAVHKAFHDDMIRVQRKRAETLTAGNSLLHSFDIPGMVLAAGGGALVGSYLGYMPERFQPIFLAIVVVGVVLGGITRVLRKRAEDEALARWNAMPEQKEYERIARELAEAWARFGNQVKRESGFHTELRVGEGSTEPQRLCSIDPRGFAATPPSFDPEDWLPTEGGGIRYEEVDVMGELVTRGLEGVDDLASETGAEPEADAKSEAKAGPDPEAESEPETESEPEAKSEPKTSEAKAEPEASAPSAEAAPGALAPKETAEGKTDGP